MSALLDCIPSLCRGDSYLAVAGGAGLVVPIAARLFAKSMATNGSKRSISDPGSHKPTRKAQTSTYG